MKARSVKTAVVTVLLGLLAMVFAPAAAATEIEPTEEVVIVTEIQPAVEEAQQIVTAPLVDETLVYLYQKLDITLPAAWENSGEQDLYLRELGTEYLTLGALPTWACGPGWGAQFDVIQHDGSFIVPLTVTYPEAVFSAAGVLVKAKHVDLVTFDCVPEPTPTPEPTVTPVLAERLPDTGAGPSAALIVIASGLLLGGSFVYVGARRW